MLNSLGDERVLAEEGSTLDGVELNSLSSAVQTEALRGGSDSTGDNSLKTQKKWIHSLQGATFFFFFFKSHSQERKSEFKA